MCYLMFLICTVKYRELLGLVVFLATLMTSWQLFVKQFKLMINTV